MLELLTYWDPHSPLEYCLAITFLVFLLTDVHVCGHGVASLEICHCPCGSHVQNMLIFGLSTNQQCPLRLTILSNTLNFILWCSSRVHVLELYRMIDWIRVLYNRTFVGLLISFAFYIWCRLLTMLAARPIFLSTSLSHDAYWVIFPPSC